MGKTQKTYRSCYIYLILALGTFAVFRSVLNCDFLYYDDQEYVVMNDHVQAGLTAQSVKWAFSAAFAANWHPLTWLSHMLDFQLFGLNPKWHHLTNLLLHIANTLLLFTVLKLMTGALWQSAFVAALFAVHPLHVESVAWVAERKDVLSTMFWLLTMAAYMRYVRLGGAKRYMITLLAFALGLMAKPMLVTLPFVLLLLDYWPLGRLQSARDIKNLIFEKLPFFVFSAASSLVTFLAQRAAGVVAGSELLPLKFRIANAVISYTQYIAKMLWPNRLATVYPYHIDNLSLWRTAVAALLLIAASILAARLAAKHKYTLTGWLWFLGTLVPVIGLVQVGCQAMADRYSYIPLTGLFIIIAWGVPEALSNWRYRNIILSVSAAIILLVLSICTYLQLRYWRNSIALFEHTLAVTENNAAVHNHLGYALYKLGRTDEAIEHYYQALRINPSSAIIQNNLGIALESQGKADEAISHYIAATQIRPNFPDGYYNTAHLLASKGKLSEAADYYRQALKFNPDFAEAHNYLALALKFQGRPDEAIDHFQSALRIRPDYAEAYVNLGITLASQGRFDEAISHYRKAIDLKPDFVEALNNLAWVLVVNPDPKMRDANEAIVLAERASELTKQQNPTILNTLAAAYAASGQFDRAITTVQKAIELADSAGNNELSNRLGKQLELYKQGKP
jgi:tetratricopeptide (TPR) repeat protein